MLFLLTRMLFGFVVLGVLGAWGSASGMMHVILRTCSYGFFGIGIVMGAYGLLYTGPTNGDAELAKIFQIARDNYWKLAGLALLFSIACSLLK